jgi:hypothetical protein
MSLIVPIILSGSGTLESQAATQTFKENSAGQVPYAYVLQRYQCDKWWTQLNKEEDIEGVKNVDFAREAWYQKCAWLYPQ